MVARYLDLFKNKRFVPDPEPVAIPVGMKRPATLAEQVARLCRSQEFNRLMDSQGFETFEEADDFDIPDDLLPPDPGSPYEDNFDMAAVQSSQFGVTQPFDEASARAAYSRVQDKVSEHKRGLFKRKSASSAGEGAPEGDGAVDTQKSEA